MATLGQWTGGAVSTVPTTTWAAPSAGIATTQDRNDGSAYAFSSGNVLTLPSSGLASGYMMVAMCELEDTSNGRCSPSMRWVQSTGTGNFESEWTGGFLRDNSEDRAYISVVAFVDNPSASSTFTLQWASDGDLMTGGTVRSTVQVIPFEYAAIGLYTSATNARHDGTGWSTTTNRISTWSTSYESDNTKLARDANDFQMKVTGARYLSLYSTWRQGFTTSNRTQRISFPYLNGSTELRYATTHNYFRQASCDELGGHANFIHESTGASNWFTLRQYRGPGVAAWQGGADNDGTGTIASSKHLVILLQLNDDAEVIQTKTTARSSTLPSAGNTTDLPICPTGGLVEQDSAAFTRSSDTQINVEAAGDYLIAANLFLASTEVSNTTRNTHHSEVTVNGTEDADLFHGGYIRNNQSTTDTFGASSNIVGFRALSADDKIGVSTTILTGSEAGGSPGVEAGYGGMWLLNLDSLDPPASGTTINQTSTPGFALADNNATIQYDAQITQGTTPGFDLTSYNATVQYDAQITQAATPGFDLASFNATVQYDAHITQQATPGFALVAFDATLANDITIVQQVTPGFDLASANATIGYDAEITQGATPDFDLTSFNVTVQYDAVVEQVATPGFALTSFNASLESSTEIDQTATPGFALVSHDATVLNSITISQALSPNLEMASYNATLDYSYTIVQGVTPDFGLVSYNASLGVVNDVDQQATPDFDLTSFNATIRYDAVIAQGSTPGFALTSFDASLSGSAEINQTSTPAFDLVSFNATVISSDNIDQVATPDFDLVSFNAAVLLHRAVNQSATPSFVLAKFNADVQYDAQISQALTPDFDLTAYDAALIYDAEIGQGASPGFPLVSFNASVLEGSYQITELDTDDIVYPGQAPTGVGDNLTGTTSMEIVMDSNSESQGFNILSDNSYELTNVTQGSNPYTLTQTGARMRPKATLRGKK